MTRMIRTESNWYEYDLRLSDMRKSSRLESDDGDGVQMFAAPLHSDG